MRTILLLIWFSLHCSKPYQIVYPRKVPLLRSTRSALGNELQHVNIDTGQQSDSFSLYLKKNKQLLTSSAVIEWHYPNGTKQELNLLEKSTQNYDECLLVGGIIGKNHSLAALDVCNGYKGYIQIGSDGYIIQPVDSEMTNQEGAPHSFEKIKLKISEGSNVKREKRSTNGWNGYYLGDIWQTRSGNTGYTNKIIQHDSFSQPPSEIECNGPFCQYHKVKKDDPKWLETVVAVDDSVIQFHGSKTVKRYILTLLNIVSAIYGDPTLGADLKFVILRLVFFEGSSNFNPIDENDSKQSLENVNKWNEGFWKSLPDNVRHDIAIWLTRLNIGGPSGYAPVDGVCDPGRSCSLNRDEGLSSAFIIAHELGHILGLSHDGDKGAGNGCKEEASYGSVMAPMVGATFSYFHWSSCSSREYHYKSNGWKCAFNYPYILKNATFIGDVIEYTYSLDDQCRMEFGEGFKFCTSFQLSDPCTHLWCSHRQTPNICKTKKGPPMDGTKCGPGKWCVNGYCEPMSKRRTSKDGLRHNPRSGGWGQWSSWGECSRTCGTGAQFRSRQCDNPRPAYGGQPCIGDREEFRLCSIEPCEQLADFRAQQCQHLFEVVSMDYLAVDLQLDQFDQLKEGKSRSQQTWYPYEHKDEAYKCKLTCFSRDTREYYQTGEKVVDGTRCSYDRDNDICIQGKCIKLGCDKILGSPVEEDECGICGGDGSKCKSRQKSFERRSVAKIGHSKLMILPAGARNLEIAFHSSHNVSIALKERQTNLIVHEGHHNRHRLRNDDHHSLKTTFVTEGTKFTYETTSDNDYLYGRGPLLAPIVVLASSDKIGVAFSLNVSYTVSRLNDPLFSLQKHEWVIKGWSKCSKECGGGHQRLILSCVDKSTGRRIRKKLCGPKSTRPTGKRRKCNTFSCDFEWAFDRWEQCTHTCGSQGLRIRPTYCVPSNLNDTDVQLWRKMVDPRKCPGDRPERIQECNRVPCPAKWIQIGWSDCSTSCGNNGIQRMRFECQPPDNELFYDCGLEPISVRKCLESPACPSDIVSRPLCQDDSPLCKERTMMRYCIIPEYRKKCCHSCANNHSSLI